MNYTRLRFKTWLEALPEKPFCQADKCPISQFVGLAGGLGLLRDSELAYRIDIHCDEENTSWGILLPSEIISIIDSIT